MDKIKEFFKEVYASVKLNGKEVLAGYPKVSFALVAVGFIAGAIIF